MTSMCGWIAAIVVASGALGCGDNTKPATPVDSSVDAGRTEVERGRYIMNNLGACTFCHTPLNPDGSRDLTRLLAGVDCLADIAPDNVPNPGDGVGVGCISSRNLTNDATGLKNVTDQQIKDAIRMGTRTDGKTLAPVMPYWIFHNMTDADLDAVVAYLRTVPGVSHTVQPNEPPWSVINDNGPLAALIDPADIPMPVNAGADEASALRGRYLSGMAGLCIDCHTPDLPPTGIRPIDITRAYAGGRMFPKQQLGLLDPSYPDFITTRNLTPDATGLQTFTVADLERAIAEGKDKNGNGVCAATHGNAISPYAALDPQDLTDIATYIHYLAPVVNDTGADCMGPPVP